MTFLTLFNKYSKIILEEIVKQDKQDKQDKEEKKRRKMIDIFKKYLSVQDFLGISNKIKNRVNSFNLEGIKKFLSKDINKSKFDSNITGFHKLDTTKFRKNKDCSVAIDLIKEIFEKCTDKNNFSIKSKNNVFQSETFMDMLQNSSNPIYSGYCGDIEIDDICKISKDLLTDNVKNLLDTTFKNLGELIAPIIIMSLYDNEKGISVTIPKTKNNELIDFTFNYDDTNVVGVSVKYGEGHSSSVKSVINNLDIPMDIDKAKYILDYYKDTDLPDRPLFEMLTHFLIDGILKENTFYCQMYTIWFVLKNPDVFKTKLIDDSEARKFIFEFLENMLETKGNIKNNNIFKDRFFMKFMDKTKNLSVKEKKNFLTNLYKNVGYNFNVSVIKNEKIREYIRYIYELKTDIEEREFFELIQNIESGTLYSIFIYNLYARAIKAMNEIFCSRTNNILGHIMNLTKNIKQIYIFVKKTNVRNDISYRVRLMIYNFQKSKFKFTDGGINTKEMNKSFLAFKMII